MSGIDTLHAVTAPQGPIAENSSRQSTDTSPSEAGPSDNRGDSIGRLLTDQQFLTQFCQSQDATEALTVISTELDDVELMEKASALTAVHVDQLFDGCLERGCLSLCLSIYEQMTAYPCVGQERGNGVCWPAVDFRVAARLIMALTRRMNVEDALTVLNGLCGSGSGSKAKEIVFGKVIDAPVKPYAPLTVVQPQEGIKTVVCSASRYLFEVFSGDVTRIRSEALQPNNDLLISLTRALKLWSTPPIRAIHEVVVTAPSGISRSFRFGTEFSDIPAQEGDRISVICAPVNSNEKNFGIFDPIPNNSKPGQPLSITNHGTSMTMPLIRPPEKNTIESIPSWILPAAIILAGTLLGVHVTWDASALGSDAASSLIDPQLPLIGAITVATVGASVAIGNSVVLPRLKQLPVTRLGSEPLRQELLRQHQILISKLDELRKEASNDVRSLAKLWQLESKMTSVGSSGKYEARLQRIDKARQSLELESFVRVTYMPTSRPVSTKLRPLPHDAMLAWLVLDSGIGQKRLIGRLELMHGYRRVANMIEIEVEMDVDVPAAEVEGIEEQLSKLEEVENLQEEMEFQISAQDEVERLLRSTD